MDLRFKRFPDEGITFPKGFKAEGVFCDIKSLGTGKGSDKGNKRDLGLLYSEVDAAVAGMFTTNQVCAAPVKIDKIRLQNKTARAVVANSGNANACTGEQGMQDADQMTAVAANLLGIDKEKVLVCSTGRIGVQMPMQNIEKGIKFAFKGLGSSAQNATNYTEAIMTSDSSFKNVAVELTISGKTVRVAGTCKGAGMIQPNMSRTGARPPATPRQLHATMLGFITTDVAIDSDILKDALEDAVAKSFNRISVDGDMSTNDTVLVLANGLADNTLITSTESTEFKQFAEALDYVCLQLALKIVHNGEGVSHFITLKLQGAETFADADAVVRSVANSALVKTSWCGGDPNWGRILDAIGYSSAHVIEEKVDLAYSLPGSKDILYVLKNGQPTPTPLEEFRKITEQKEFDLHIFLNMGNVNTLFYTADLTEEYVDFNKGE